MAIQNREIRGGGGKIARQVNEAHRSMVLKFRYPLQLHVVEACRIHDAEADKEYVL